MTRVCESGHPDRVKSQKKAPKWETVAYMALFACSLPLVLAVEAVRAGYWRMRE